MEDVFVQIDKFYYPVDFLILDTESVVHVNEVTTRSGKNVDSPHIVKTPTLKHIYLSRVHAC